MNCIAKLYVYLYKLLDRALMYIFKSSFAKIGNGVTFHPTTSQFSYDHIFIGSDVGIGDNAQFIASISNIHISSHIAIAPNVTIIGGNHRYDIVGKWITKYKILDKNRTDDEDVYIEDDCWIGTNVTILKGVRIRRGSIIAAGAIVNKSMPPYCVIGGVPARVLKLRWNDVAKILEHERSLYKPEERLPISEIEALVKNYAK